MRESQPSKPRLMNMPPSVNLGQKLAGFSEYFQPRTVASFNGNDVMVVKIKGQFKWHAHPDTDDFFLVLRGQMRVETEEGTVPLSEGEMCVIPRGMRHRPVADEECQVLLIEPMGTPNTGDTATAQPRRVI